MKGFFKDVGASIAKHSPFNKKNKRSPNDGKEGLEKEKEAKERTPIGETIFGEHDDFGFKIVHKLEQEAEETPETADEFCSVDASDLIKDKQKAFSRKEWIKLLNDSYEDKKNLHSHENRKRILKSIIKNGVPTDL